MFAIALRSQGRMRLRRARISSSLGTVIRRYLFFWQAGEDVEDM
jgi:hypothetical protein